jgi:hypothetical protein
MGTMHLKHFLRQKSLHKMEQTTRKDLLCEEVAGFVNIFLTGGVPAKYQT